MIGVCKIRKKPTKEIIVYKSGRGKVFNYKYIGKNTILVYKKDLQFIVKEDEFDLFFDVITHPYNNSSKEKEQSCF